MKAISFPKYGSPDLLQLVEVDKPEPKDDEVLVKIHAASINKADWYMLSGKPFVVRMDPGGLFAPKINVLGGDVAGRIEAIGKQVTRFQVGDAIYADISGAGMGAFAEFVCVPENLLAPKPVNLSFEEAAAVPSAAVTALQGLRDAGEIASGQTVLINGASGGVGTFAVQIAKSYQTEVSAVCSTGNIELVRSIGADHVVDYTQEDFSQSGRLYDLIVGINGRQSLADYKRVLSPTGTYVCIGGSVAHIFASMLLGPLMSKDTGRRFKMMGSTNINQQDLFVATELIEAGKVSPVIDRQFTLNEVPEAMRYFGKGHAKGKVVIAIAS